MSKNNFYTCVIILGVSCFTAGASALRIATCSICRRPEAGETMHAEVHVPVPAGTYTVKLYHADTWNRIPRAAGFKVSLSGFEKREVNPWKTVGGSFTAAIETWLHVKPDENGEIALVFEDSPQINGLEIIR